MALLLSSLTAIFPWLYLLPFDFAMEPPRLGPALAFHFTINAYLLSCVRLPPLFLKRPTGIMRHGASKAFLGIYGHHFLWPLFCILYLPASRRARRTSPLSIMCPYCTYT